MLTEALVSFSIMLLLVAVFVPQGILLLQERKSMKLSYQASMLLKERAISYLSGETAAPVHTIQQGGVSYQIWSEAASLQADKVCVSWKDGRNAAQTRCRIVNR